MYSYSTAQTIKFVKVSYTYIQLASCKCVLGKQSISTVLHRIPHCACTDSVSIFNLSSCSSGNQYQKLQA